MKHNRVLLGFLAAAAAMMFLFCGDNIVKVPAGSGEDGTDPGSVGGGGTTLADDGFSITKKGNNYIASRLVKPGMGKTTADAFPYTGTLQGVIDYINTNGTKGVPIEIVFGKNDGKDKIDIGTGTLQITGPWGAPVIALRGAVTGGGKIFFNATYNGQQVFLIRELPNDGYTFVGPPAVSLPPSEYEASVYNYYDEIAEENGFALAVQGLRKALPQGGFSTAQEAINSIKAAAVGKPVAITLGRGGSDELDLRGASITFEGEAWGDVTLKGAVASNVASATSGVIIIGEDLGKIIIAADELTIRNTAAGNTGNKIFVTSDATADIEILGSQDNKDAILAGLTGEDGFLNPDLVTPAGKAWLVSTGTPVGIILLGDGTARLISRPYGDDWGYSGSATTWKSDKGVLTIAGVTAQSGSFSVSAENLTIGNVLYTLETVTVGTPTAPAITGLTFTRLGATTVRATFTSSVVGTVAWATTANGTPVAGGTVTASANIKEWTDDALTTSVTTLYVWVTNATNSTSPVASAAVGTTIAATVPQLSSVSGTYEPTTKVFTITLTSSVGGYVKWLRRAVVSGQSTPPASELTNGDLTTTPVTAATAATIALPALGNAEFGTFQVYAIVVGASESSVVTKVGSDFDNLNPNLPTTPGTDLYVVQGTSNGFASDFVYDIDNADTTVKISVKSFLSGDLYYIVKPRPSTGSSTPPGAAQYVSGRYVGPINEFAGGPNDVVEIVVDTTGGGIGSGFGGASGANGFDFYAIVENYDDGPTKRSNVLKISVPGWDNVVPVFTASLSQFPPPGTDSVSATLTVTPTNFGGKGISLITYALNGTGYSGALPTAVQFSTLDTVDFVQDPAWTTGSKDVPVDNVALTGDTIYVKVESLKHAAGGGVRSAFVQVGSSAWEVIPPALSAGKVVTRYRDSSVTLSITSGEDGFGYYKIRTSGSPTTKPNFEDVYDDFAGWTAFSGGTSTTAGVVSGSAATTFELTEGNFPTGAFSVDIVARDAKWNISDVTTISVLAAPSVPVISDLEWAWDTNDPAECTGFGFKVKTDAITAALGFFKYINAEFDEDVTDTTYAALAAQTGDFSVATNGTTDVVVGNTVTTDAEKKQSVWVVVEKTESDGAKYYSAVVHETLDADDES